MRKAKKAIGTVLAAAVLLGTAFGTPAQVSAQTRESGCHHNTTTVCYSRTEQEGSYTHIVTEEDKNGKIAYVVCTVIEETEYYYVKCNTCGAKVTEYQVTVTEHSYCK